MTLKEDIKKATDEIEDIKSEQSFALELLSEQHKQNKRLFIANVLLSASLIISLIINLIRR